MTTSSGEAALPTDDSDLDDLDAQGVSTVVLREQRKVLRDQSKELKRIPDLEAELNGYKRRDAIAEAMSKVKLPDGISITADDLSPDLPLSEITPELLQAKAAAKKRQADELLAAQAAELGFESVDQYRAFAEKRKAEIAARKQDLSAGLGALNSGDGGSPGSTDTKTPQEIGWEAYEKAISQGASKESARALMLQAKGKAEAERREAASGLI